MIDPNNLDDLIAAIYKHPDYIAGVIFTIEDVLAEADEQEIARSSIKHEAFDLRGWEAMATEDGWNAIQDCLYWCHDNN